VILLLLLMAFICYAGDRPGTPVPSSHRQGFIRVWSATPPGTPTTPTSPKTPKVRPTTPDKIPDIIYDDMPRRKRGTHVTDDDLKRNVRLDHSMASTYMSSESDISISKSETIYENGQPVTVVTWEKCLPDPGWWEKFLENFRVRKSEKDTK
jgi:hypothetical protein